MEKNFDAHSFGQAIEEKVSAEWDMIKHKRIEIRQGLSFRYNRRKVRRELVAVSVLAAFVIMATLGFYRWQGSGFGKIGDAKAMAGQNNQVAVQGPENNIWDLDYIANGDSDAHNGMLLVVSGQGDHMVVSREDIKKDYREVILEFDRSLDDGADAPAAAVALSPDKKTLAYAASDGLHLYGLASKENRLLVGKEKLPAPPGVASEQALEKNIYAFGLVKPQWSFDSRFLSFVQVYAESRRLCVIDTKSAGGFVPVGGPDGGALAGLEARWAPDADLIIDPESGEGGRSGIFIIAAEKPETSFDLGGKIGRRNGAFQKAAISTDGKKVALTFKDGLIETPGSVLAVSNIDGSGFSALDRDGIKAAPFFSPGGRLVFFISETKKGSSDLLAIDVETKERREVGSLPKDYDDWSDISWLDGRYLAIFGNSHRQAGEEREWKSIFLLLDVENKQLLDKKEFSGNVMPIDFLE
ncbi:MAG: hypothetical protein Q8L10_01380 [Candidatus Moranbacteria bacterium]|nr:hypothetical protein [Candidatus Moranbacteria bacterium]